MTQNLTLIEPADAITHERNAPASDVAARPRTVGVHAAFEASVLRAQEIQVSALHEIRSGELVTGVGRITRLRFLPDGHQLEAEIVGENGGKGNYRADAALFTELWPMFVDEVLVEASGKMRTPTGAAPYVEAWSVTPAQKTAAQRGTRVTLTTDMESLGRRHRAGEQGTVEGVHAGGHLTVRMDDGRPAFPTTDEVHTAQP